MLSNIEGGVVVIGNFDGVHLGHQAVIATAVNIANELGCPASVMTFEPYPAEYFTPQTSSPRLSSRRQKVELLMSTGVDAVVAVQFNAVLAQTSAEEFVKTYLYKKLQVRHVVVGVDFRFGTKRVGDISLLKTLGMKFDFNVSPVDDFKLNESRVSSTHIRNLLAKGELSETSKLLGREFSWKSKVVHGDKRGRTWGFPTANMIVSSKKLPIGGVFVVRVEEDNNIVGYGVTNVGTRPTVGVTRLLIETHLFNKNPDLYGRVLNIVFLKKIREEKKFADFDALKEQILRDVEYGKRWVKEEFSIE